MFFLSFYFIIKIYKYYKYKYACFSIIIDICVDTIINHTMDCRNTTEIIIKWYILKCLGKTLAFGLPVLDFLLRNWSEYSNRLSPVALIIAPTRELALQISTVLKEVSAPFKNVRKVEIVVVVGGFSEHKQRRLLCGGSGKAARG